jgi:hypothetical protein
MVVMCFSNLDHFPKVLVYKKISGISNTAIPGSSSVVIPYILFRLESTTIPPIDMSRFNFPTTSPE